ncbi:MAG: VOC family protein [Haloarculaceae archaeon]
MDVIHTALWVSDVAASVDFYTTLDLRRQFSFEMDGVENVYVGGRYGQLQLRHDPDRADVVDPDRSAMDHVAVGVEDCDAAFERVREETNAEVVAEPTVIEPADARAAFVTDPDGYVVELVEPLAE